MENTGKRQKPSFAVNISTLRKKKGWNQDDLAAAVGVHLNTIKHMERGLSEGQPKTRRAIAEALGVSESDLFRGAQVSGDIDPYSKSELIASLVTLLPALNELELRNLLATAEASPSLLLKRTGRSTGE